MKSKKIELNQTMRLLYWALFASSLATLSGCGKTAFNPVGTKVNHGGPGYYSIPPKVDLMLFVDDTGVMIPSYSTIATEVPAFLNQLDSKDWDYHFVSNALTTSRSQIPQVAGSIYDGSNPNWIGPYPGAPQTGGDNIIAQFFRTAAGYTDFISASQVSNSKGSYEPGFMTMQQTLSTAINGTGFRRHDAPLVILTMGLGNDSSQVNVCRRSDGWVGPCGQAGMDSAPSCTPTATDPTGGSATCNSYQTSLGYYTQALQAFGSGTPGVRFYAAVNTNSSVRSCLNTSNTFYGDRYIRMASALGGESYDICSKGITGVLNALSASLQARRSEYQTKYVVVAPQGGTPPNPSTITVTKYLNGDTSQSRVLSQSSYDGWTYAGLISNTPVIDAPVAMDNQTGYAIELHGAAKLHGSDSVYINYTPAGVKTAVSN
jgi:hypothetical protein